MKTHEENTDDLIVVYIVRYPDGRFACVHASYEEALSEARQWGYSVDSTFLYGTAGLLLEGED